MYPPKQKKIKGYYYWVQAYTNKHNRQTTHYIGKKLIQSKVLTIDEVMSRD